MNSRLSASDSVTSAKEVMAKALQPIEVPEHEPLFDGAQPYWDEILSARANSDWPAEDLTIAAKLANIMFLHKRELDLLQDEGGVIYTQSGNAAQNPRMTVVKTLMSDIKATRVDLQIHGRGKNGETRDISKRRGQRKQIERGAVKDDLIARPNA